MSKYEAAGIEFNSNAKRVPTFAVMIEKMDGTVAIWSKNATRELAAKEQNAYPLPQRIGQDIKRSWIAPITPKG